MYRSSVTRCLSSFLLCFLIFNIASLSAIAPENNYEVNLIQRVALLASLKNRIEILSRTRNAKNAIALTVDMIFDIEGNLFTRIDLGKEMSKVATKIRERGGNISDAQVKAIYHKIKSNVKRRHSLIHYIESIIDVDDYEYNEIEEQLSYEAKYGKDNKQPEVEMPTELVVGVTMVLVSGFIFTVPLLAPLRPVADKFLLAPGIVMCTNALCKGNDDRKK